MRVCACPDRDKIPRFPRPQSPWQPCPLQRKPGENDAKPRPAPTPNTRRIGDSWHPTEELRGTRAACASVGRICRCGNPSRPPRRPRALHSDRRVWKLINLHGQPPVKLPSLTTGPQPSHAVSIAAPRQLAWTSTRSRHAELYRTNTKRRGGGGAWNCDSVRDGCMTINRKPFTMRTTDFLRVSLPMPGPSR